MSKIHAIQISDAEQLLQWNPPAEGILLRSGTRIDVRGNYWRIPTASRTWSINLDSLKVPEGVYRDSIVLWAVHNLRNKSVSAAANAFYRGLKFFNSKIFLEAATKGEVVPYLVFSNGIQALGSKNMWQAEAFRSYYRWAYSQRFSFFDDEVLTRIEEITIGGNVKGEAVRSANPDKGPLSALEVAELAAALRAAYLKNTMPLDQQAAIWLALAFGANAGQYALMREINVVPEFLENQIITTLVSVPRHKKRYAQERVEFATRKANRFVSRVLRDLIAENEKIYPSIRSNGPRPLFWRASPRSDSPGLEEWEWHLRAPEFTNLLRKAIDSLFVRSRSGAALKVSVRRLRYTLASRMVAAGASPYALAAALDHSDLQNVGVYFDVHSDIVEHLDEAMAMVLADRAAKFAQIVDREEDAINGGRPGSRRYVSDREQNVHEPIGTCGHTSFCNVVAPYACYTCPKFQAWIDGPHELVLDKLIESRTSREQMGLDPRFVGVEDQLIVHVAEVIKRIAETKAERGVCDE